MAEQTLPVRVKHTLSLELGENAFWLSVWTLVAITLIVLAFILCNRSAESDHLIANSADPVATACATGLSSSVSNQCMALLARRN